MSKVIAVYINNLKILFEELLGSINLFGAQTNYIYEMIKIFIIAKHKEFMLAIF